MGTTIPLLYHVQTVLYSCIEVQLCTRMCNFTAAETDQNTLSYRNLCDIC